MRQRDAFISTLFERAKNDKDIYLISVDMGAPSLDQWRDELPNQFFAAGISEQNAINFASGLAANGKKVYVYFMAAWSARCFEQVRYSCAMANIPITILGNGVGLGYAPAGPAHEPNEDVAYMRSLCGIEVISPANSEVASALVDYTLENPNLRYLRLERKHASQMDGLYQNVDKQFLDTGVAYAKNNKEDSVCIFSSGYMLGRSLDVADDLDKAGIQTSVVDLFKIKPLNSKKIFNIILNFKHLISIEEQTLSGGFGSALCEAINDHPAPSAINGLQLSGGSKKVLRIGLPEKYIFENGTRDHLLNTNGLSQEDLFNKILKHIKR